MMGKAKEPLINQLTSNYRAGKTPLPFLSFISHDRFSREKDE